LDVFEFYQDPKTRRRIVDQMNEYIWFFRYEEHIYRFAFIIKLTGLFTKMKSRSTVNFHALAKDVRNKMKNDDWIELRDLIASATPTVDKIEIIRNSAFAHRSAELDLNEAFKAAGVTRNELKKLTEVALDVVNRMAEAIGTSAVSFHSSETECHMRRMFQKLGSTFPESQDAFDQLFDKPKATGRRKL